jgi:hypothetical protein
MALRDPQRREAAQLLLVTREYLQLAAPPPDAHEATLGATTEAWTRPILTGREWRHTVRTAHLASAAVRLTALDELLEETQTGPRNAVSSCRAYFKANSRTPGPLARHAAFWFHVLLRDAIGHPEPGATELDDPQQLARYQERHHDIAATTWADAIARLTSTTDALTAILTVAGVRLPTIAP